MGSTLRESCGSLHSELHTPLAQCHAAHIFSCSEAGRDPRLVLSVEEFSGLKPGFFEFVDLGKQSRMFDRHLLKLLDRSTIPRDRRP